MKRPIDPVLREAHSHSSIHRTAILASPICGCFHCLATYPPSDIADWTDRDRTALCPRCGIDSVLGSGSGVPITSEFLGRMKDAYFRPIL